MTRAGVPCTQGFRTPSVRVNAHGAPFFFGRPYFQLLFLCDWSDFHRRQFGGLAHALCVLLSVTVSGGVAGERLFPLTAERKHTRLRSVGYFCS